KAGQEYLTPGSNDYDSWLQTQTYDVTELLKTGDNQVALMAGDGWAIGNFYFEGGSDKNYADNQAVLMDLVITYEDGTVEVIATDNTWTVQESQVLFSSLYNGEVFDATFKSIQDYPVKVIDFDYNKLEPRRSLPVVVQEEIKPIELIHTKAGELVLDFGQNMAGWVRFTCREPQGNSVKLQYGEILQGGNFYRDNLRHAKAEYIYTADGQVRTLRPHFTYYGFRYVKLTGFTGEIDLADFVAEVAYSEMEDTGDITTSNALINRLIQNTVWGQKSNFFEVPTDCPQRDERLGWTGDAQVFSGTAAFQMDVLAFFSKFGYDMGKEQAKADGCVPFVVPSFKKPGGGSCAWADAATIIPWTMYLMYGDIAILEQQYGSMKAWADYIRRQDDATGAIGLWTTGFHFGDWLALDADDPKSPIGGTETPFIASCYYYYSTLLVAKAAKVLGFTNDAASYEIQAGKIKAAIIREYYTPTGRLALQNQTAYVLVLAFDLCKPEDKARVAADLITRLKRDKEYLKTGFVGTPLICRVLSENGYHDMACKLLLNDECPSWLYPVRMGATTIWERWNSVMPDGSMNPEGMNSLNHYSYGSIVEWMYRYMAGINPVEDAPGFRKAVIRPQPDYRMSRLDCTFKSAAGTYVSNWEIAGGQLEYLIKIPFNTQAQVILPDARLEDVFCNEENLADLIFAEQKGSTVSFTAPAGIYAITYAPTVPYERHYSLDLKLDELMNTPETRAIIEAELSAIAAMAGTSMAVMGSVNHMAHMPFIQVDPEHLKRAAHKLGQIKIKPDILPPMIDWQ
ncbi:MAG: alfa-L-rhamnosidase RamA, partial [Firmicutes bacterium]|nr:alfa-L-rhamnosidase RamA [Bacillota bacterium]